MNIPLPPLINGKVPEWANIVVNILGVPFTTCKAIEYAEDYDMKNVMGIGSEVIGRIYGQNNPDAKITLLLSDVENMRKVAPLGKLQRIPEFDISVTYVDDSFATIKHKIRNCRIKNSSIKTSTGSEAIECELNLVISHVEWQ